MKHLLWMLIAAGLVVSIIADLLIPLEHIQEGFWWEHIPGFFAALGFFGCVAIVYVAKALGKWWLQRKENYYD